VNEDFIFDGPNDYAYVQNSPVMYVDPTGLEKWLFPWEAGASWNPLDTLGLWFSHTPSEHYDGLYTGDTNPTPENAHAAYSGAGAGANAGLSSVCYAYSRPTDWVFGEDFGAAGYYDDAWQQSGLNGTWTQSATDFFAGGSAIAGYGAVGVWGWGAAGGGQFAVGYGSGHVSFGWGTGGVYTWGHGLGSAAGFATTWGARPGTTFNITGIPIWNPNSIGVWMATQPQATNCATAAGQAFVQGWKP
jgi:hypothetical protein